MPHSRNAASSLKVSPAAGVGSVSCGSIVGNLNVVWRRLPARQLRDGTGSARALLRHPLVARERKPVARARHRDVEQPPLVGVASLIARCVETIARQQPVLGRPVCAEGKRSRSQRGHEHDRPLQALGAVDRGQVDRVQREVVLAVEAFVGPLGVVDDVRREVAVVPGAAVLAADLLALRSGSGRARRRTDS